MTGNVEAPTLLNIAELETPEWHRHTTRRAVSTIVENFNYLGLGYPIISLRDGKYFVVDGLHRIEALKQLGIKEVFCDLHTELSMSDEVTMWQLTDMLPKATVLDAAKARVFQQDATAVAIDAAVQAAGFTIDYCSKGEAGSIKAYKALEAVYHKFSDDTLQEALQVIRQTLGTGKQACAGYILQGFAQFLHNYSSVPVFNRSEFMKRVKECGIEGLQLKIKQKQAVTGTTKQVCTVLALIDLYNKNIKPSKKLHWAL